MTKKEIEKKFKFSGKDGECSDCEYVDHCDKILPGFNKPGKCDGPFHKDNKKKDKKRNTIKINESQLRQIIAESVEQALDAETNEAYEFERLWEEFEDWMDSYNQSDYPTSYSQKDIAKFFYFEGKKAAGNH